MRDRGIVTFSIGFAAVCLSCPLVAPVLPLRLALPTAILFGMFVALSRKGSEGYLAFTTGYASIWMIGCILSGEAGALLPAAMAVLLCGLGALTPLMRTGLMAVLAQPNRFDFGVSGGVGFLAWFMAGLAMCGRPGHSFGAPLTLLLVGCVVVWLAVRAAAEVGGISRRIVPMGLGIVACAQFIGIGGWAIATLRARLDADGTAPLTAYRLACTEENWARRMGAPRAIVAALDRQASVARDSGNPDLCRRKLRQIARLAPPAHAAWQWLLQDSLDRHDRPGAREALAHVPDECVSRNAAERMAVICAAEKDLPGFLRAWRLCGGEIPPGAQTLVPWLEWGKRCYFAGRRDVAETFLVKALALNEHDWVAVRLLYCLQIDSGKAIQAATLVDPASTPAANRAEAAYLRSELARRLGDSAGARRWLEETLLVEPGYYAARRRMKEESTSPETARSTAKGVATTAATLQLLDSRLLTPEVRPGGIVRLRLRWQALAPVDPAWRVFVHVREDQYGGCFFRADHGFRELGRDPGAWAIGTDFSCEIDVPIPDAALGSYTVLVGVRDPEKPQPIAFDGGTEAPDRDHADRVSVGALRVIAGD